MGKTIAIYDFIGNNFNFPQNGFVLRNIGNIKDAYNLAKENMDKEFFLKTLETPYDFSLYYGLDMVLTYMNFDSERLNKYSENFNKNKVLILDRNSNFLFIYNDKAKKDIYNYSPYFIIRNRDDISYFYAIKKYFELSNVILLFNLDNISLIELEWLNNSIKNALIINDKNLYTTLSGLLEKDKLKLLNYDEFETKEYYLIG